MERLQKVIASSGYTSRRKAEELIKKGKVYVNGEVVKELGTKVNYNDEIVVEGVTLDKDIKKVYYLLNKPRGYICSTNDELGRKTVNELIASDERIYSVGRLDYDTTGLIILTNDGELNHRLISPKWKVDKVYYAKIDKKVTEEDIAKFKAGITLDDGYLCKEAKLEILNASEDGSEIIVTIQEGKFHQVKRMFEAVGKSVIYLKRVEFGTLPLDEDLEEGEYRELTEEELAILKSF